MKKSIYSNNLVPPPNEKRCYINILIGITQTKSKSKSKSSDANHTDTNRYECAEKDVKKVKATIIENGHHVTAHCLAHIHEAIKSNSQLKINVNSANSREIPKSRFDEGHQHRAYAHSHEIPIFWLSSSSSLLSQNNYIMNCSIHSQSYGLKRRKSNETKIKVVNFSLAVCLQWFCLVWKK